MVESHRTGAAGKTLTVLAQELSDLSKETRAGATESIKLLQNIMERTEEQVRFSTDLDQNREEIGTMIEKAKHTTWTILSSMQEVNALAQKMGRDSQNLSTRINKLVPGIRFPQIMGDRIERNWLRLCDMIDELEGQYPQFTQKNRDVEQMMEKLSQKYVMDRERSIHAQVAGGGDAQKNTDSDDFELFGDDDGFELFEDNPGEKTKDGKKTEQEFDDNVELF
jgi:chromosome segregation ATPase